MDYELLVKKYAGVVSTKQLRRTGATKEQIDEAVALDALKRERWGWYSTRDADPDVAAAVAAGGVLTCRSALRRHGLWAPDDGIVHFRTSRHHRRTLGADVGCGRYGRPTPFVGSVDDVPTALAHAAFCLPAEDFIVLCDSALNKRLVSRAQLLHLLSDAPDRVRHLVSLCDGKAESGTETMVRLRLRGRRIKLVTQARIANVGRVDLRVGRRLIIEVDSRAHHTGEEHYESDRLRDLRLTALGFVVVRLTYAQVVHRWDTTLPYVEALIQARAHH